jgi:hypothetical protein
MPRAKKIVNLIEKTGFEIDKSNIRISAKRKYTRRNSVDRRKNPGDVFWEKVIKGFKNFLKPPPWSK